MKERKGKGTTYLREDKGHIYDEMREVSVTRRVTEGTFVLQDGESDHELSECRPLFIYEHEALAVISSGYYINEWDRNVDAAIARHRFELFHSLVSRSITSLGGHGEQAKQRWPKVAFLLAHA